MKTTTREKTLTEASRQRLAVTVLSLSMLISGTALALGSGDTAEGARRADAAIPPSIVSERPVYLAAEPDPAPADVPVSTDDTPTVSSDRPDEPAASSEPARSGNGQTASRTKDRSDSSADDKDEDSDDDRETVTPPVREDDDDEHEDESRDSDEHDDDSEEESDE